MGAGAGAGLFLGCRPSVPQAAALITRVIPSSGERIPVVGIGARNYRVGDGWAPESHHAVDNLGAATGRLPTPEHRRRMEEYVDALPAPPRRGRR